jgi:hypothetical protein
MPNIFPHTDKLQEMTQVLRFAGLLWVLPNKLSEPHVVQPAALVRGLSNTSKFAFKRILCSVKSADVVVADIFVNEFEIQIQILQLKSVRALEWFGHP